MKKHLLPFLAAACLCCLTACGSEQPESSSSSAPAPTEAVQQEETVPETEDIADETAVSEADAEETAAPTLSEDTSEAAQSDDASDNDMLVVYFSATGTTAKVAERIADVTGADTFEIVPAEPYSDADLNWHDNNSRSSLEMNDSSSRPAIAEDNIDLNAYSAVFIGYPIWWGDAPRIMSTFVEAHSFEGLTVIPFCTSSSSPIGSSGSGLAALAGSGNWLDGKRLDASVSESELSDWISSLDLHLS